MLLEIIIIILLSTIWIELAIILDRIDYYLICKWIKHDKNMD